MKTFFASLFEIRCQAAALLLTLFALSVTDVQGQLLISDEVELSVSHPSVGESAGATIVTVTGTLVGGLPLRLFGPVRVMVIVGTGTATEDTDFVRVPPFALTIDTGETTGTATFTLIPVADDVDEYNETVSVSGTAETNLVGGIVPMNQTLALPVRPTTVTIEDDDDPTVSLSVSHPSVGESAGATTVTVTGTLVGLVDTSVTVMVTVGTVGTATEDTDFVRVQPFALTIKADETTGTATFTLIPVADDVYEDDETVSVSGTAQVFNQTVSVRPTTVTIEDDDDVTVSLSVSHPSVGESAGATTVTVTGTLVGLVDTSVTVEVTVGTVGTATEDTDFVRVQPFALTIKADETTGTATFTLIPVADDVDEDDETVSVSGTAQSFAFDPMPVRPTTVTITDDDTGGVTVLPTVLMVDERGTGTYTVVLDSEPTGDVTVTVGGTAGTGISVDKRTLTFTTTNWMMEQTVTVSAMEDEDAETNRVTLTHTVNGYPVTVIADGVAVTVNDTTSAKEEKIVVKEIVNVIAASTVSNVTSNIGARFSSVRGGGAVLTLAGQPVNIEQTHSELIETVELYGSNSGIEYGREIQSLSEAELLRNSSFKVALAATEDDGTQNVGLSQLTLWGQGDFQTFQNDSESANYDGDLKAGYLGIDTWINEQWLAGIATSRIMVDADYSLENSDGGNLELTLTGLHPYLRFVPDERSEYWIILGTGDGEIENQRRNESEPERNEVKMSMGAAGVRRTLSPNDRGVDLAIIGDAGFGRMETKSESGLQTIDNLRLNTWRVRLGVEGSKTKSLAHGATLRSFAEVAGRLDGGAGDEESGLELSVGMFFFNPNNGLGLEVRGRTLLLHSAKDYQEHGGSITGSLSPRSDGLGTNLAVSLRWGAETKGVDTLWREGDIDQVSRLVDSDKAILNSRLGYGIALNRGLLTPYGEYGLHDQGGQHVRVGVDFGRKGPDLSVFNLGLFGERKTNIGGESEHKVNLSGRLRF